MHLSHLHLTVSEPQTAVGLHGGTTASTSRRGHPIAALPVRRRSAVELHATLAGCQAPILKIRALEEPRTFASRKVAAEGSGDELHSLSTDT